MTRPSSSTAGAAAELVHDGSRRRVLSGPGVLLLMTALVGCGDAERPSEEAETASPAPARRVLLVSFDTTRADRLGCYGHGTGTSPAIDALAARGIRFENAFAQVPLTLPSHATLLTGTYPAVHGIRVNGAGALGASLPTMAESFSARGYRTAAFVSSVSTCCPPRCGTPRRPRASSPASAAGSRC